MSSMNTITFAPRRWLVVAGLVVALGAALLVSSIGGDNAQSAAPPAAGHDAFAVLRWGPAATIDNPRLMKTLAAAAAGAPVAVHAGSSAGGAETHLVQAGTYICLVTVESASPTVGGYGCSPDVAGYASDDLSATITFVQDGYAVSGATPDGVHDVAVTTADGAQPADIANNTFTTVVKSTPTAVDWVDAAGVSHHHALINPDIKP
jgi:hypothetical protein